MSAAANGRRNPGRLQDALKAWAQETCPKLSARSETRRRVSDALRTPIPRQQVVDALGRVIRQAGQDVGEPPLRIDIVEFGGGDEGVDGSRAPAALVGAGEGPISSYHGDGP